MSSDNNNLTDQMVAEQTDSQTQEFNPFDLIFKIMNVYVDSHIQKNLFTHTMKFLIDGYGIAKVLTS